MLDLVLVVAMGCAEGGVITLGLLTLAVLVHESGHALVGKMLGLELREFRVTPFGGLCDYVDDDHSEAVFSRPLACVALYSAGGIANALMAVVMLAVVWHYGYEAFECTPAVFAAANIFFGVPLLLPSSNPLTDTNQVRNAWAEYLDDRQAATRSSASTAVTR